MFKQTLNKKGFECTSVDPTAKLFIADGQNQKDLWSLEIGAGFGADAKAIVLNDINLYCNDLDERHLKAIQADLKDIDNIKFFPGNFFELDFEEHTIYSIYTSRVIHFLTPEEIDEAFTLFRKWLIPGGKLFLTVETPFLGNWKSFIPEFQRRKEKRDQNPGFINNPAEYEDSGFTASLPESVHWFDEDSLRMAAERNGFTADKIFYIDRKLDFPEALLLDGRESVGAVLVN